jgi:aminopeptidase-like protein
MAELRNVQGPDRHEVGIEMHQLAARLYPICRSITGDGLRQTLHLLKELVPLEIVEVPSGTEVLDWTIPPEWSIREAWIADADGRRIVDIRDSNLHVVSYSVPVRARMSLAELKPHLHSLPDLPDRIPYRTSYYHRSWGFCLSQHQLEALTDGSYEVCIDSTLEPGALTYGELVLPGESEDEVLLSAHVCHPSLADDNLSGVVVATFLARELANTRRRLTLRFLFAPGTIGTLAWLARNRERLPRIRAGLTLVCLGDSHPFTYKRTISGTAEIDRAASHILAASGYAHQVVDYFPYGYDERQYNAPGFRLPVGSLMRGRHGRFPEYHTSADDLSFIAPQRLAESRAVIASVIELLDANLKYRNLAPNGEPQLGRRGLYQALGGGDIGAQEHAMLWVLSLSDGEHTLLDIAERAGLDFAMVRSAARLLVNHRLLDPV